MAIYSEFSHKKMVIFHSYVKLPEGTVERWRNHATCDLLFGRRRSFRLRARRSNSPIPKPPASLSWGRAEGIGWTCEPRNIEIKYNYVIDLKKKTSLTIVETLGWSD